MQSKVHIIKTVRGPRGAVLITAMWIAIALAAVVLVLGKEMLVETMASQQHLSQAKVDAAEIGAEQYVLSVVEQDMTTPGYHDQVSWQQRQIGECYFWVLGVNLFDETQPYYGLVDEASKIDMNTATGELLDYLPQMELDSNISQAIMDWRDSDDEISYSSVSGGQGSEMSDYESLSIPYRSKNLPFESVEELRLVLGVTDEILWGADLNHNNTIEENEQQASQVGLFSSSMRGLASFLTPYGLRATAPSSLHLQQVVLDAADGYPETMIDPVSGEEVPVIDINNTLTLTASNNNTTGTSLQQMLQDYAPTLASQILTATQTRLGVQQQGGGGGGGGGGAATQAQPFKSVAEWMVVMAQSAQATSQDLHDIYPYLVCYNPTIVAALQSSNAGTTATPAATNDTSSTTTQTLTIEGVLTVETIAPDANEDYVATYFPAGQLNINTASKAALMSLTGILGTQSSTTTTTTTAGTTGAAAAATGLTEEDVDAIIQYRDSLGQQDAYEIPNITWLLDVGIDPALLAPVAPYITGTSKVFSADIVTVSKDGRAFKRVKIVVDASTGTPQIIYRRDMTDSGWPMDPGIRTALKTALQQGQDPGVALQQFISTSSR